MNAPGPSVPWTTSSSATSGPPNLAGRITISGEDTWEFEVDDSSPLKATTTSSEAVYRTECLNDLASGLTIFDDRLSLLATDDIRTLRPSDLEGRSSSALRQDNHRRKLIEQHFNLWAASHTAFSEILHLNEDEESEQARFLAACLRVNFRVYSLMAARYVLKGCEQRLKGAGRDNEVVDTQVELNVWDRELCCKVKKFCSSHPWLTLDLKGVFSSNGPLQNFHPPGPASDASATSSTSTPTEQAHNVDQQQQPVGTPGRSARSNGHRSTRAQWLLSVFESLVGARRGHSLQATATTQGTGTDIVDPCSVPGSDVECPICTLDLYVSPSDNHREEAEPLRESIPITISDPETPALRSRRNFSGTELVSQLGAVAQYIANMVSPTTKTIVTTKKQIARCKVCTGGEKLWVAQTGQEIIPPKPFFCPTCRKGYHIECIWKWFNEGAWRNRKCPCCRTSVDRSFVEHFVRPRMLAERRRKRKERCRLARSASSVARV